MNNSCCNNKANLISTLEYDAVCIYCGIVINEPIFYNAKFDADHHLSKHDDEQAIFTAVRISMASKTPEQQQAFDKKRDYYLTFLRNIKCIAKHMNLTTNVIIVAQEAFLQAVVASDGNRYLQNLRPLAVACLYEMALQDNACRSPREFIFAAFQSLQWSICAKKFDCELKLVKQTRTFKTLKKPNEISSIEELIHRLCFLFELDSRTERRIKILVAKIKPLKPMVDTTTIMVAAFKSIIEHENLKLTIQQVLDEIVVISIKTSTLNKLVGIMKSIIAQW